MEIQSVCIIKSLDLKRQSVNFRFYFKAMFSSKTGRRSSSYYCLFLLVVILLVKNQVSQYVKAQRKWSGLIRVNLNSSNASIRTKFITALRNPKQRCCSDKLVFLYLCSLLLANSYAPEPNPGPRPIIFPCVICEKAVRWNTRGVCCDSCDRWYHQRCMGMAEEVYCRLKDISWECFHCDIPNFSLSLFDTTIFETSNSFSYWSDSSDTEISFSNPAATSSPSKVLIYH